ncbi:MAG: DNA polymerase thumb domain-containing protein, partial [Bacilli bacterium]
MEHLNQFRIYRNILCIDLKAFFASAECAALGLDPYTTNLVVADKSRGKGGIVLATSPALKKHGFSGRFRLFELPPHLNVMIIKPRMAYYVDLSNQILKMYLTYFAQEDILVYSIDEVFIDLTSYLSLYKTTPYKIARALLNKLNQQFKLHAACGLGQNMLLAKMALDIEAKHNHDHIATWTYQNIKDKLWPITDLTSVWGIGRGHAKTLKNLGISSMYDLAHYDIYKLVKIMGIAGEELYLHAHGIDISL